MRRSKPLCTLLLALLLLTCAGGKPAPVEPQDSDVDADTKYTCIISISCETILDNIDKCVESKKALVPEDGIILPATEVTFSDGESVYDVLQRVCKEAGIQMESSFTPAYNSAYVEGINNLYEVLRLDVCRQRMVS